MIFIFDLEYLEGVSVEEDVLGGRGCKRKRRRRCRRRRCCGRRCGRRRCRRVKKRRRCGKRRKY